MWNNHNSLYLSGIITFALSILQHNVSGSGLLQHISLTLCVFSVPYTIKLRHNKTELSDLSEPSDYKPTLILIFKRLTHSAFLGSQPCQAFWLSHHSVTDRFWLHVSFSGLWINCIIKKMYQIIEIAYFRFYSRKLANKGPSCDLLRPTNDNWNVLIYQPIQKLITLSVQSPY